MENAFDKLSELYNCLKEKELNSNLSFEEQLRLDKIESFIKNIEA